MTRRSVLAATFAGIATVTVSASLHVAPRLLWNETASVPVGLYRVQSGSALHVGDVAALRLVSRIKLIPQDGELAIFLEGDLAAILNFSSNKKSAAVHPDHNVLQSFIEQDTLVAGEDNQRYLLLVEREIPRRAA